MERPSKQPRYSVEPDLLLEFDDGEVGVVAYILMKASPVFEAMLQAGMRESVEGRLKLVGKKARDFRLILQHIDTAGCHDPPAMTDEDVPMLLQWADEYQMRGLTKRVERFLLTQEPGTVDGLALAAKYQLEDRREQCLRAVSSDFQKHLKDVPSVIEEAEVMSLLWPVIFQEAGLRMPHNKDMSLAAAWPAIALGIWKQSQDVHTWRDNRGLRVKLHFSMTFTNGSESKKKHKLKFICNVTDPLQAAMSSYRRRFPLDPGQVYVFKFEDERLSPEHTLADLGWSPWHGILHIDVTFGESTQDL